MNAIGDMQDEMDFFCHCEKFEYNHDYVMFFMKNCLCKGGEPNLR